MEKKQNLPFIDAVNDVMEDFLHAMPEITVDLNNTDNIRRAFDGNTHRYIKVSFKEYLNKRFSQQGRM